MSAASSRHMAKVAAAGCRICAQLGYGHVPAEVHHAFDTADRDDWLTIALCHEHHRGATGFHGLGEREFNRRYKTNERKLLADTLRMLDA